MSIKSLPSRPSLNHLRYQAKDLLTALKARQAAAFARLLEFHPKFARLSVPDLQTTEFSLADAQLVIAREYGFESWPKLKLQMESLTGGAAQARSESESREKVVRRFLEYACPDHHVRGGPAHLMARQTAVSLLKQYPEIAHHNLVTAVVCGELSEAQRLLGQRPEAAVEKYSGAGPDRSGHGNSEDLFKERGPKSWEPLLFLCFTRLPVPAVTENAVEMARLLLDHGADPNVYFMAGHSRYTTLVGLVGEGEENRAPHPRREEMVRLLLERGAEPYDTQVVYDIHFRGDVLWFLKLAYEHSVRRGRKRDWDESNWSMFNMGGYGCGARWHIEIAIRNNDVELAEWLLAHGANPDAAPATDRRFPKGSLYQEAMRNGCREIAALLIQYGAKPSTFTLTGEEAFVAAVMSLDREQSRAFVGEHPEYLRSCHAMFMAVPHDRADAVALLIELGTSPSVADSSGQTALHLAAFHGAVRVAERLIASGAEVDRVDSTHRATPLWWAIWGQQPRTSELLGRVSRDVRALTLMGNLERLRQLLAVDPGLAMLISAGTTPLMWLPGDDALATEIVELLLPLGVDPSIKNTEGLTAADLATKRGLDEAAALLQRR